ncbi:MAG: ATP-dependent helicase, partial [Proteobacteria bacterium]
MLYLSLSPFLVENCRKVYHAQNYVNESQNIDFLSLKELIGTIAIPDSREIDFRQFSTWFQRYKTQAKDADSYQVFEEFRGVITGLADGRAFLSHDEYLALGPKQSLFPESSRTKIYGIFEEYRKFLDKEGFYDPNLLAFRYLGLAEERYDAVVIDEVQDFTSVQILLAMKLLRKKGNFIFSGDSNQVVHPNFFSWSKIKSMFYDVDLVNGRDILRILSRNYRCASCITDIANKLLRVKQVRFGSIDRESHYLIESLPSSKGAVCFLPLKDKALLDLNNKTKLSSKHAVIVLDDTSKDKARRYFQTPLVFSVREAKGLEYENVILYNIVSDNR